MTNSKRNMTKTDLQNLLLAATSLEACGRTGSGKALRMFVADRELSARAGKPSIHAPPQKRYTSDLNVACILDEFTAECLSYEVKLTKLTQKEWQQQLDKYPPDFLLVESCWKGNDGDWGTISLGSGGRKKLSGLLSHCHRQGIPTVFWNKEDPPHYEKFGGIAEMFDLALTTDANMVPRYKKDFGINVYPLSFGAQPKIHNPAPVIPRLNKAVFAGSYYSDKPERCTDFNEVMSQLKIAGLQCDIFDRNHLRGIEKFFFPECYRSQIVGTLSPSEVWKAHKGYKYQVNMNSVKDSSTMFARRVFESLASGTPVISNASKGVRELFGDLVIMQGDISIADQLEFLQTSSEAYHSLARRGVRIIMRKHTYGHRMQALCRLLGLKVDVNQPEGTLAIVARNEADISRAKQLFQTQTAPNKRLFVALESFDTAYKYLNENTESTTFAMKRARDFYKEDSHFYGSKTVLKHEVNEPLSPEALEDFLYWGYGQENEDQVQRVEMSA